MEDHSLTQLLPPLVLEKLEFDKLLDQIRPYCASDMGQTLITNLSPVHDLELIKTAYRIIGNLQLAELQHEGVPFNSFSNISPLLEKARAENAYLEIIEFFQIKEVLVCLNGIEAYFNKERISQYPWFYTFWDSIQYNGSLFQSINRVIDEQGAVRPNASPELVKISKAIHSEERALDNQFNKLVTQFKNQGWLTDNEESVRNGRRVLSIKSEYKRKLSGIIHDESATGKTTFIEPNDMVILNNKLFDLWMDHKKEVRRILISLSDELRPFIQDLLLWQDGIIHLDTFRARGKFGTKIDGIIPKLSEEPKFDLKEAKHPLLLIKHAEERKKTESLSLHLGLGNNILLLSGPNAGGKSVALKTVGLICLMTQCSIPIPAHVDTEIGLFRKIFVDIGDQQSIEDDLSTYSSRLTLMRDVLRSADENTLVLIDEFGSGTDPAIGGAIAAEMLLQLLYLKTKGFITTHYSDLKLIANRKPGIVNGAMMFDKNSLTPTYQLRVGKPGSSYALEIAAQCGLPDQIIRNARKRMGEGIYQMDKLLSSLEDEKKKVENLAKSNEVKEKQLDKLIKSYENMSGEFEIKRKKLKLRAKEMDLQYHQKYQQKLDSSLKKLQGERSLEKMKALSRKIKTQKQNIKQEVEVLDNEIYSVPEKNRKPIIAGAFVKHQKSGVSGQLVRIEKKKGVIQVGELTMTIPMKELQPSKEPLPHKPQRSIQTKLQKSSFDFSTQLDVRGLKKEEAIKVVESFVDQALMANASTIKILHGKGNGVLKKLVWEKLNEYDAVESIRHPEQEWGGEGISIARFASV